MNFHETQMGHEFYGKTVPKIAKALEQIAKSLDKPAPATGLPFACEVPADFLSQLYQGNYDPSAEILANETSLRAVVSPDIWEQIDHTFFLMNKRGDGQREQAFAAGYRTAMMMVMAGLSPAPRAGN